MCVYVLTERVHKWKNLIGLKRRVLKMIRVPYLLVLCLSFGYAQPVTCIEDAQCLMGYFCEESTHTCRQCLRCQDYKREASLAPAICTKSVESCGPCFEGLVNVYGDYLKGKCAPPESLQPYYLYLYGYLIAAIITLLIVVFFVFVLYHTEVFEVVAYDRSPPVQSHVRFYLKFCGSS